MREIPLIATPRQSLSVVVNQTRFGLRIYETQDGLMCMDVTQNDTTLLQGAKCVPSIAIPQYAYMRAAIGGGFAWITDSAETLPYWSNFSTTACTLYWVDNDEL